MAALEEKVREKLERYRSLTGQALKEIAVLPGLSEKEAAVAADYHSMAKNYFLDARHFEEKGDLATALAAYSYAHAWLDAGVRARLFDVGEDDKLFTLP